MKIVYMGTPDFAVPPLRAMAEAGYEIAAVVTQPDKPKGRGKTLLPTPVKAEALKYGIPVFQPMKVREADFQETLREIAPDIIVVAAFGQIIPRSILELPRYGCINIHASLLPKYRGAAPIQYAVIDGEKESGVTIMRMGEGLDTGDMISRISVPLAENETGGSLFDKLSEAGAKLLIETLPHIFDGSAVYEKQPEESPTPYAAMIKKEMGKLDFSRSAAELERLVRGLNPWPSAYTCLNGKNLKIWESHVETQPEKSTESATEPPVGSKTENGTEMTAEFGTDASLKRRKPAVPGTVLRADKSGIYVACGEGTLILTQVQLEGKKRMAADAFLRGYKLEPGVQLGRGI